VALFIGQRPIHNFRKVLHAACRRVLEAKYKLGLFSDPYRGASAARAEANILTAADRRFAREVAARSCVLLKNEPNILPLKRAGTIALIGPLADARRDLLGPWSAAGDWRQAVTAAVTWEK
jgi:beta-glucosidase